MSLGDTHPAVARLTYSHIRANLAPRNARHERIDQIAKADADRGRALDARIDKLVSAIGELLRTRNGH